MTFLNKLEILGNCRTKRICIKNSKSLRISTTSAIIHWIKGSIEEKNQFYIEFTLVFSIDSWTRRILCWSIWWWQWNEKVNFKGVFLIDNFNKFYFNILDFWRQQYSVLVERDGLSHVLMNHIYVHHSEYLYFVIVFTLVSPIQLYMQQMMSDSIWAPGWWAPLHLPFIIPCFFSLLRNTIRVWRI